MIGTKETYSELTLGEGDELRGITCWACWIFNSIEGSEAEMSKYNLDEIDEDKRDSGISKGKEAHMDEWRGRRGTQMQARLCGLA